MEPNQNLQQKISELTISQLKDIIASVVKETLEEILEDKEAKSSTNYINSIREAREDYKTGNVSKLEL
ncbi:MAG: hypothetical protein FD122_3016 [Stygiobacter sp.]|nr:MAG: hypothetical protein FD122_3016 [Stygiobacter sp.]KAF0214778.1 MAG: hypothetical protein FD178_2151 [Ignavibacteria bacterium]